MNAERKRLLDHVESNPDAWIGHHGPEKSYRPYMNKAKELVTAGAANPRGGGVASVPLGLTIPPDSYPASPLVYPPTAP